MLARRARLQSRTPLRRKTWMRQRSEKRSGGVPQKRSRYRSRPRETERMLWIKTLPCCAPGPHVCHRVIEAHHAGKNPGMRLKAPDDTCIPLCKQAHTDLDAMAGVFRYFDRAKLRAWQDEKIAHYQALWEQRQAAKKSEAAAQPDSIDPRGRHAPGPGGEVAPTEATGLPTTATSHQSDDPTPIV